MNKQYTKITKKLPAQPRNERLRAAGSVSGGVTTAGFSPSEPVVVEGHTHSNLADIERLRILAGNYLAALVDGAYEKIKAGYADMAHDLDEDSPVRSQFLSSVLDDIAQGRITFEQGLTSLGIAVFSDTVKSPDFEPDMLTGSGWGIDASGTMELNTLRVRQRMEVLELLINRLQAIEGDAIYTEADAIERVEEQQDGSYDIYFKSKWEGYFTAISAGSVLKGIYNSLAAAALGGSTVVGTETPAAYYTSWMLVRSVNQAANMANVSLYPDAECPGNANHAPCPLMTVARWGHQTDPDRQQCFYISSTEGRIVKLNHVDKPKLAANGVNHSMILGRAADWLADWLVDRGYSFDRDHEEVVFGDVGVFRKIIQYTGDSYVEPNIIDKGPWQSGTAYLHAQLNPDTQQVETWDCWHLGCRWRSMAEDNATEPAWNNPTWAFIEGNPATLTRRMRFVSEFGEFDTFIAHGETVHFYSIIEDGLGNDRSSEYTGWTIQRHNGDSPDDVASDGVWNATRASIDNNGEFYLTWSESQDDLQAERATFIVEAQLISNQSISVIGKLSI